MCQDIYQQTTHRLVVAVTQSLLYNLKKTGVHFFMAEHSTQNKRIKMLDQKVVGMVRHELRGICRGRTANYIPIYFLYLDLHFFLCFAMRFRTLAEICWELSLIQQPTPSLRCFSSPHGPSKKIGFQMQASKKPCPQLPTTPEHKKQQTGTSPKTNMLENHHFPIGTTSSFMVECLLSC